MPAVLGRCGALLRTDSQRTTPTRYHSLAARASLPNHPSTNDMTSLRAGTPTNTVLPDGTFPLRSAFSPSARVWLSPPFSRVWHFRPYAPFLKAARFFVIPCPSQQPLMPHYQRAVTCVCVPLAGHVRQPSLTMFFSLSKPSNPTPPSTVHCGRLPSAYIPLSGPASCGPPADLPPSVSASVHCIASSHVAASLDLECTINPRCRDLPLPGPRPAHNACKMSTPVPDKGNDRVTEGECEGCPEHTGRMVCGKARSKNWRAAGPPPWRGCNPPRQCAARRA